MYFNDSGLIPGNKSSSGISCCVAFERHNVHTLHLNIAFMVKPAAYWSKCSRCGCVFHFCVLTNLLYCLAGWWGWWRAGRTQELHMPRPPDRPVRLECQVFCSACHEGSVPILPIPSGSPPNQTLFSVLFFCLPCLCESHVRQFVLCVLLLQFYEEVVRPRVSTTFASLVFALIKTISMYFFSQEYKKKNR